MANKGIIQSGGNINANNIAAGDNASINSSDQELNVSANDIKEVSELLTKVITKLKDQDVKYPDKDKIITSVEMLKDEVNKEKPNKITIRKIGRTILDNLKYVKDVAPLFKGAFEKIIDWIK